MRQYYTLPEILLYFTGIIMAIFSLSFVYHGDLNNPLLCATNETNKFEHLMILDQCLNSPLVIYKNFDELKGILNGGGEKEYTHARSIFPSFALQLFLIFFPIFLFKHFISTTILNELILDAPAYIEKEKKKKSKEFVKIFLSRHHLEARRCSQFGIKYFLINILYVLAPLATYYVIFKFSGSNNLFWVFDSQEYVTIFNGIKSTLFPSDLICEYFNFREEKDAISLCFLKQNISLGIYSTILSYWLLFLSVINFIYLVYKIYQFPTLQKRQKMISKDLDIFLLFSKSYHFQTLFALEPINYNESDIENFAKDVFTFDLAIMFSLMKTRFSEPFMLCFMVELFRQYKTQNNSLPMHCEIKS